MDITAEQIKVAEDKYTAELKDQLISLGHTIDESTKLPTFCITSSVEHENIDVAFAVPLYRLLDRLASQTNTIIKRFGIFFDPESARRSKKAATYAWISYVHFVDQNT